MNLPLPIFPISAFLHDPTLEGSGDVYADNGWTPVTTTVTLQSATVKTIDFTDAVMTTNRFRNESSVASEFTVGATINAEATTETTWQTTQSLSLTQTVNYGISFFGTGVTGETGFGYEYGWGQGGGQSEVLSLGSSNAATVTLQPGQAVEAELRASRGTMTVEVVYAGTLSGSVAVALLVDPSAPRWSSLDIGAVLAAGGAQNQRTFTTTVELDYYSSSEIVVRDLESKEEMARHSTPVLAGVA